MANNKKNDSLPCEDGQYPECSGMSVHVVCTKTQQQLSDSDEDSDSDYDLGKPSKITYWHNVDALEEIRKDYLMYECGVSLEDYEERYKKKKVEVTDPPIPEKPKLKQLPFKIVKRKKEKPEKESKIKSWVEKKIIAKIFKSRRESLTSDTYTDCDSIDDGRFSDIVKIDDDVDDDLNKTEQPIELSSFDRSEMSSAPKIKEVAEGKPCNNCPEICPGFVSHPWRKTCKSCGCDRMHHAVYHEELLSVRQRLGLREGRGHSYDNNPPGLTAKQSDLYWSSLGSAGGGDQGAAGRRSWRSRAFLKQLPQQDLALAYCKHVDEEHKKQFEDFVAARNEIALDIGNAQQHHGQTVDCEGCNKSIRAGSIAVQAPRLGEEAYFHPACFMCVDCNDLLVDLAYCTLDGRLYCLRHYGERLKPRCYSCDEVSALIIFKHHGMENIN